MMLRYVAVAALTIFSCVGASAGALPVQSIACSGTFVYTGNIPPFNFYPCDAVYDGITDDSLREPSGQASYWLGRNLTSDETFTLNLGAPAVITGFDIFNTHNGVNPYGNDRGTVTFTIWTSLTQPIAPDNNPSSAFGTNVVDGTLSFLPYYDPAPGTSPNPDDYFAIAPTLTQYVTFRATSYVGSGAGLSEIRVDGASEVPEPAPLALVAAALTAGLWLRGRRRLKTGRGVCTMVSAAPKPKTFLLLPVLAIWLASSASAGTFTDGFEGASFNPFWTASGPGTAILTNSVVYDGSQSALLSVSSSYPWYSWLSHDFGTQEFGSVSVWVDTGVNCCGSAAALALSSTDDPSNNFAAFQRSADGFHVRFGFGPGYVDDLLPSTTAGWHEFEIDTNASGITFKLDGSIVYTNPQVYALQTATLTVFGGPAGSEFFDDFSTTYNPAAATLEPGTLMLLGTALVAGITVKRKLPKPMAER
jgi:hypothetical protein